MTSDEISRLLENPILTEGQRANLETLRTSALAREERAKQAAEKPMLSMEELLEKTRQVRAFEELYGPPTPEPLKLTEAEQRERWDKAEAARSEMQRNAPCQFTGPKYPPSDWPEQGPWRPAVPPVIKPEPTEDEIKAPPVGSTVIVKFSDISKQAYRVLTQPDSMGLVKCTPLSGMMVGKVFEMHVREF